MREHPEGPRELHDATGGREQQELGRWYVFALRYVTAVRFGRRPTREELLGDRLLLTAFRMSDPTEELRGSAFLEQAAARLAGQDLEEVWEAFQRAR